MNADKSAIIQHYSRLSGFTEEEMTTLAHPVLVKSLQSHGIHFGHINSNGFKNKLDELRLLLSETNLDILAVTETHLSAIS